MKVDLKNDTTMVIRSYEADDFHNIHHLNADEDWTNLVEKRENTKAAWDNSNMAYVATTDSGAFIGYIRGHTDTRVSLFVCEMLVDQ